MDFKERLKELRKSRGISQAVLADRLGMSKSTIGMYETGAITPSIEALNAIADHFNVSISYLMGEEDISMYYLDPETAQMAQELFDRPEMKVLFDASRNASKEDIEAVAKILERMSQKTDI